MKHNNAFVATARIVVYDIFPAFDETAEILKYIGTYEDRCYSRRVYAYEVERMQREAIEAFEKRFRGIVSGNKELRKEMRKNRDALALLVRITLDEFSSQGMELVNCWTFADQIADMARTGRSIALSFCNDAEGNEVHVEIPASFVKLLAKYGFSFRFVIG